MLTDYRLTRKSGSPPVNDVVVIGRRRLVDIKYPFPPTPFADMSEPRKRSFRIPRLDWVGLCEWTRATLNVSSLPWNARNTRLSMTALLIPCLRNHRDRSRVPRETYVRKKVTLKDNRYIYSVHLRWRNYDLITRGRRGIIHNRKQRFSTSFRSRLASPTIDIESKGNQ